MMLLSPHTVCVILTDNVWLYLGIKALMPDISCHHVVFGGNEISDVVPDSRHIFLMVDSLIFTSAEWRGYLNFRQSYPEARVVWLSRPETGMFFPANETSRQVLNQKGNVVSLKRELHQVLTSEKVNNEDKECKLTLKERIFLRHLAIQPSKQKVAIKTGMSEKTAYRYQHDIMLKSGFRSVTYMRYIYEKNINIKGLSCY